MHRLIADLVAEGAERSVRASIRETRQAVFDIQYGGTGPHTGDPISIQQLAGRLGIDPSAARRRAYAAISAGYLENTASPRRPMSLKLGDAMPEEKTVLPTPATLEAACSRARTTEAHHQEQVDAAPAA